MRRLLAAVLVAGALAGCGSAPEPAAQTEDPPPRELVVFAAASLTEAFEQVADDFEADNPGVTVTVNFGGSPGLAQSIVAGAPADVFAAASPATMAVVVEAGLAEGEPSVFARNALQLAVPPGNPARVTGLADLAKEPLKVALCAVEVPCGAAAERALKAAGLTAKPDTLEQDVKAVLAKVRAGEVDAGLVYVTDVQTAGADVEGIDLPADQRASADYPAVVLSEAPQPELAAAFVAALTEAGAQQVLTAAGFLPPA